MKRKTFEIVIAFLLAWTLAVSATIGFLYLSGTFGKKEERPTPYQIDEKYESRYGRCYVHIWVEVTPEEYIGLDVGDEFELK